MLIRQMKPEDRPYLADFLSCIACFNTADCRIALELIDTSLYHPEQKDYLFLIAVGPDDHPCGYACYGPTPLTSSTFDLYWIAVDSALAGNGVGTRLIQAVEQDVRERQGRMVVLETSSDRVYASTRHFYTKNGYTLVATIRDFYRPGEHRLTYIKRLDVPNPPDS